jgi:cytochrome c biogenesis protein CcmG, thiol:disulfide interchange protein DsbE
MQISRSATTWNIAIALVLIAGVSWIVSTRTQPQLADLPAQAPLADPAGGAPQLNALAPQFTLNALDGSPVALADLRGKVVLVNIWASWCPPCRSEMPTIQNAYQRYQEQGFVVLAINQREDSTVVANYMREQALGFPTLLDSDGAVGASYQASALPASFFIGRDGRIRALYRGPLPRGVLDATITSLLAEPRP